MKFNKNTRWHFRTQLALVLLITGLIVAATTDAWFHHFETDYLLSSHHKKNKQTAMLLSRSAVTPVLEENNVELENFVKAMFQVDLSLIYVKIIDTQGRVILQKGSRATPSHLNKEFLQELKVPVKSKKLHLANIHIIWDNTSTHGQIMLHVGSVMWILAFTMLLLSVLLFSTLKYLVVNPIERVNKKLQATTRNEQTGKVVQNPFISKELSYLCYSSNCLDDLYQEQVSTRKSLAIAMNKAEEANQTKNEFLSVVSHELRTPINGVLGLLEVLMKDKNLTQEQINNISVAHSSANSLFMTISNILDFSQTDGGTIQLKSLELNLPQLVNEVTIMATKSADQKSLNLHCVNGQDIPKGVYGDPVRIRQILNNLLSNAIKFTEMGNIIVSTELVSKDYETAEIRISVRDTGVGISPEKEEKLFLPFYQIDTSSTRVNGGIGLGLAINHHLATAMDGEINVKSELGKGSTFSFTLPLKIVKESSPQTKLTSTALPPLSGTILLAEDNLVNKMVATKILQSFGLKVEHAINGAIAYELFKQKPFDVILMDIQMPKMDGYESSTCIRHWENEQQSKHIPIIALTANVLAADKDKCFEVGMSDFSAKPINTNDLHHTLKHWLEVNA